MRRVFSCPVDARVLAEIRDVSVDLISENVEN
jgi:hypothetical protein